MTLAPVSVIMPAYRAATTIQRALTSIARQTYRPEEVIVVDDGSDDRTADAAEACRAELGDIRLIVDRQPNRGAGAARNRAIGLARCAYLAFLDADDEWMAQKLKISLAYIERGDLALIAHNGYVAGEGQETLLDCARLFRKAALDPFDVLYRRGFIATSSVVVRRESIAAAGGFDETLQTGQDFDLWLRLLAQSENRWEVFEDPLFRYYLSKGSITANTERRLADTLSIALRHAPTLRRRNGSYLFSLWFRIAAVHKEAIFAYVKRNRLRRAFFTFLFLPIRIVIFTIKSSAIPGDLT
jgi:glycosyltransferase involved in cell wall biosynthesis